jgi:endo-1,4-beta-D-glucanase Y
MTFNPSYYVFPAIRTFAKELPDPVWQRVWNDGLNLLTSARIGPSARGN